jgi:hypothetical protein
LRTITPRLALRVANVVLTLLAVATTAWLALVFKRLLENVLGCALSFPYTTETASACASFRVQVLSDAMSGAMQTLGVGVAVALWLLFSSWRWHWLLKPRQMRGHPPYR